MTWVFLRRGRTLSESLALLGDLLRELDNIAGRLAPPSARPGADAFVRWTERADATMRTLFESDVTDRLYDERFWRIRELDDSSVRPSALISSTVDARRDWILQQSEQLASYQQLCGPVDEALAFLDTNVYDHYQLFTQVNWPLVLKKSRVRLMVPLVVIDELDAQKDNRGTRLGKRAGKVIRALRSLGEPDSFGAFQVREDTLLSIIPEPTNYSRSRSNDDEIVRQASFFNSLAPQRVVIITGDFGMQIRASNSEVAHLVMPVNYLAKEDELT